MVHVVDESRGTSRGWLWAIMIAGGIEAAALAAGAILLTIALIGGFTDDTSMAVFVMVFGGGMAAILAITLRNLFRGKRWARGPLITWQIFQLTVAVPLLQGSTPWIGVALLILALIVTIAMFTPTVLRVTTDRSGPSAAL